MSLKSKDLEQISAGGPSTVDLGPRIDVIAPVTATNTLPIAPHDHKAAEPGDTFAQQTPLPVSRPSLAKRLAVTSFGGAALGTGIAAGLSVSHVLLIHPFGFAIVALGGAVLGLLGGGIHEAGRRALAPTTKAPTTPTAVTSVPVSPTDKAPIVAPEPVAQKPVAQTREELEQLLLQNAIATNPATIQKQIKNRIAAFQADAGTWWGGGNRTATQTELDEINKITLTSENTLEILNRLSVLEKFNNKIPLTHTVILKHLATKVDTPEGQEAAELLKKPEFATNQVSKDTTAKASFNALLDKMAGVKRQGWSEWFYEKGANAAVWVGQTVVAGMDLAFKTMAAKIVGNIVTKIQTLTQKPLSEILKDYASTISGQQNSVNYEKWHRDNMCADLEDKDLAKIIKDQGLKEGLKQHSFDKLSPADQARIKKYQSEASGLVHEITAHVASGITKTTLAGVHRAAEEHAFDAFLSAEGIASSIGTVARMCESIAKPVDDSRSIDEIKQETESRLRTASDKIALTLIPHGNNPIKWLYRKALAFTLRTYYFQELGERAYVGKQAADTFLEPTVKKLQAIKDFDPSAPVDDKTKAQRMLAFSKGISEIVDQIGKKVTPSAQTPGQQIAPQLRSLIGQVDWNKTGIMGEGTAGLAGWLTLEEEVSKAYEQVINKKLLDWIHGFVTV